MVIQLLKNYLFPINCVECDREGFVWCDECLKKFNPNEPLLCPACHLESYFGKIHDGCKLSNFFIDKLMHVQTYERNAPLVEVIKLLKYQKVKENKDWISKVIDRWVKFDQENTDRRKSIR